MCECCGGHNKTIELKVNGMSCNHCVMSVKNGISQLKGIKNIEVSLENGKVKVEYNPNDLNEALIKEAIEDAGYEVK